MQILRVVDPTKPSEPNLKLDTQIKDQNQLN